MKKLFTYLIVIGIIAPTPTRLVSCYIGESTMDKYLSNLKEFDWTKDIGSDALYYDASNSNHRTNFISQGSEKIIKPNNIGSYIDYDNYSTSFKFSGSINKQATTGVPLIESFLPNGNNASDFGVNSRSRKYSKINSILDWTVENDKDSGYSVSTKKKSDRVAIPTIASDSIENSTKWEAFRNSSSVDGAVASSVVGTKNLQSYSLTNYSYMDNYISWCGSYKEGIIVPPNADITEACHLNGVKSYGNIFLDGYHGLKKSMLNDFIKKDTNGNYLIVDILIELAKYNGFDGWFFNDESNGELPNGSIISYETVCDIVKQFNKKVSESTDESVRNLKIQLYKADATLAYSNTSNIYNDKETFEYTRATDEVSLNFNRPYGSVTDYGHNHTPNNTIHFINNEGKNYGGENLYNLLDYEWDNAFWNTYDYNEIAYENMFDTSGNFVNYDKNSIYHNSIGTFDSGGGGIFTVPSTDIDSSSKNSNVREQLFKEQIANLFNNEQVFGLNLGTASSDKGHRTNDKYDKDGNITTDSTGTNYFTHYDAIYFANADPRINVENNVSPDDDNIVKKLFYDYDSNDSGINTYSNGIADAKNAKTTIFDKKRDSNGNVLSDDNDCSMKTDFSLGDGIKFVSEDGTTYGDTTEDSDENYYPWTNKRLADVSPTYEWDIRKVDSDGSIEDKILPIDKISGQYDYDDVYRKGNSISIGSGFDSKGKVTNATFDTNSKYNWNIMGTDLRSNNHKIYFVAKASDKDTVKDIKLSVTTTNQSGNYDSKTNFVKPTIDSTLDNGWVKYSADLSSIDGVSDANPITKLGLSFTTQDIIDFKFNIGEFGIDTDNLKSDASKKISSPSSDYVIKRNDTSKNISLRLGWDGINDSNLDYYEVYWYDKNGTGYRVGETSQNIYYLRSLSESASGKVSIGVRGIFKDGQVGDEYRFDVEV